MKHFSARKHSFSENAFTLLEILIAVVIMGVLSAMAVAGYIQQREKAIEATVTSDVTTNRNLMINDTGFHSGAIASPEEFQDKLITLSEGNYAKYYAADDLNSACLQVSHDFGNRTSTYSYDTDSTHNVKSAVFRGECDERYKGGDGDDNTIIWGPDAGIEDEEDPIVAGGVMEITYQCDVATDEPHALIVNNFTGIATWSDGVSTEYNKSLAEIQKPLDTTEQVLRLDGTFDRVRTDSTKVSDKDNCIKSVDRWDEETGTKSAYSAFSYTTKFEHIEEVPSTLTDTRNMFFHSEFNNDISDWDVSNVTKMDRMFANSPFNRDISDWDTSNVTSMRSMFSSSLFSQDISDWETGKVTDMVSMFSSANSFNSDISNWDTSNVKTMTSMFLFTREFNQPIGKWDVSSVTNMRGMFSSSKAFNQDLSNWDTSSVTDMSGMFRSSSFKGNVSTWDTSSVTDMSYMFRSSPFGQDVSGWNTSNVENMKEMFLHASNFKQDLSGWNVSKVTDSYQFGLYSNPEFRPNFV